jgi:hypothetical protein
MGTTSAADSGVEAAVAKLKKASDEAYAKYNSSCSHAVWYVLTQIVNPDAKYKVANALIDDLSSSSYWKEVSVDDGWALAQKGIVVIGGLKQPGDHGHVIVIYPGEKKASGGYAYTYKDKATGKMKNDILRSHGTYPRALSTSQGSWPGAKSKGDKTVWDPWAKDDVFDDVKFWTRK